MPGKFEIKKDKAGKFRFNLIAANGEIIASSEAYETKEVWLPEIKSALVMAAHLVRTFPSNCRFDWLLLAF